MTALPSAANRQLDTDWNRRLDRQIRDCRGIKEWLLRPVVQDLAKASGDLTAEFSVPLAESLRQIYRWHIRLFKNVDDLAIQIPTLNWVHPNTLVAKVLLHGSIEPKRLVLVRDRTVGTNVNVTFSHASAFAWLYSLFDVEDPCQCTKCVLRQFWQGLLIPVQCALEGCEEDFSVVSHYDLKRHMKSHMFRSGLYHCDACDCTHTSKRCPDLIRHISTRHCLKTKNFPCPFPGCDRGDDNGFARKDKLKDHFEAVHRGRGIAPRQPRLLAPKT